MMSSLVDTTSNFIQSHQKTLSISVAVAAGLALVRIIQKLRWGRCPGHHDMQGKTVIITGANSGIGRETALDLAKRNARVILACRSTGRGEDAAKYIRKYTPNGELIVKPLDLLSFASVHAFVKEFNGSGLKLDVLINNAGVYRAPFALSEDGFETHFAVNHLGHFLLTNLLLDKLKRFTGGRVVVVSSAYYARGKMNFDDLNGSEGYDGQLAYCNSKLANMLFGMELNRRLKGSGVNVYMVSPGIVWTNLGRHVAIPWWKKILLAPLMFLFVRSATEGSQTLIHCAASEDVGSESGLYYRNCKQAPINYDVVNPNDAQKLWNVSMSLTKLA